jgi:hypothetical protein
MPYALLAALSVGLLIGMGISTGFDRWELAAYRRIARKLDRSP